jgi:hypothetical protein
MIIYLPFSSTNKTSITGMSIAKFPSDFEVSYYGGNFNATTSFDSITFIPASGTITGSISCFGFNK